MRPRTRRRSLLVLASVLALVLAGATAFSLKRPHPTLSLRVRKAATCSAVEAGLKWLARHQSPDGSWPVAVGKVCGHCEGDGRGEDRVGLTAESCLAFLGAGYTPQNRASYVDSHTGKTMRFGNVVRAGLAYLIGRETPSGSFLDTEAFRSEILAALALSEAYGITNAVAYRRPAQRAIEWIHEQRRYDGGWAVRPGGEEDVLTTGLAIMALKSGQISGLEVSLLAFEDGVKAIWRASSSPRWSPQPLVPAMRILTTIFVERRKRAELLAAEASVLLTALPKWDAESLDYDQWYFATLAVFQLDGPGGASWKRWNRCVATALCEHQGDAADGCGEGSWDPDAGVEWGEEHAGGRVHATALATLTLETYYRYASVLGQRVEKSDEAADALAAAEEGK